MYMRYVMINEGLWENIPGKLHCINVMFTILCYLFLIYVMCIFTICYVDVIFISHNINQFISFAQGHRNTAKVPSAFIW